MDAETARDLSAVVRKFGETKRIKAAITRSPTDGSGQFVAMVSPFGPPPDITGDVVSAGAYSATIMDATIRNPGALWTLWYNHQYEDPENAIGVITAAAETAEGLFVQGQLDLGNDRAVKVYEAMLAGTLREFSIGFGIVEKHWGELDGRPVRYLDVLELLEISVVWKGAAYGTRLVEVRSAPVPVPRDELAEINARLDALASNERPHDPDAASAVDQLVLEVREELIRESLARAEQAAWERRMHINMVLDPVPVRVDARMRPVTS
jgi:HK97 family phage prohead protease